MTHDPSAMSTWTSLVVRCKCTHRYVAWFGSVCLIGEMDVEEFMNQLFDKIETGLKGHPMQYFLKEHFGGKSTQQIISKVFVWFSSPFHGVGLHSCELSH